MHESSNSWGPFSVNIACVHTTYTCLAPLSLIHCAAPIIPSTSSIMSSYTRNMISLYQTQPTMIKAILSLTSPTTCKGGFDFLTTSASNQSKDSKN